MKKLLAELDSIAAEINHSKELMAAAMDSQRKLDAERAIGLASIEQRICGDPSLRNDTQRKAAIRLCAAEELNEIDEILEALRYSIAEYDRQISLNRRLWTSRRLLAEWTIASMGKQP